MHTDVQPPPFPPPPKKNSYVKRREYIDERVIWVYLIQILEGLKALHERNVLHRGASISPSVSQSVSPSVRQSVSQPVSQSVSPSRARVCRSVVLVVEQSIPAPHAD